MMTFNNESFKKTRHLSHSVIDKDFVGKPNRMAIIDSFLYVVDGSQAMDSIVHLFNLKNNTYNGIVIPRGPGPGELYSIGEICSSIDNKTIWGDDITGRKWVGFDKEMLVQAKQSVIKQKIQFHEKMIYVDDPVWISDTSFIALDSKSYKERFYILDINLDNISPVYNPYFHFSENISKHVLNDIFSINRSVKPDKSKIVLAGRYFDCLEFYSIDGICLKIVKGPDKNFIFNYNERKSESSNYMAKTDETRRAYTNIKSTNNRIYAQYSGKARGDSSHYSYSNLIYTFDWNGNPLEKYILDCTIGGFDVDIADQMIYAIKEDDASIICFDIRQ
jgi:hypothetical protein